MNLKKQKVGFTLIELLVVMAIIGVLASAMVITVPNALSGARDTQRKSDLNQYKTLLEAYANRNSGFYPQRTSTQADTTVCTSDLGLSASQCPEDPRDGTFDCKASSQCRYFYQSNDCGGSPGDACATNYVLWTGLEKPSDPNKELWVVCSDGRSGETDNIAGTFPNPDGDPTQGDCPL